MRTAQKATSDFADRTAAFARDNEQNLDRVGKASMVMGGALLAGIGLAVKAASEFDSAMSEVQSSVKGTSAEMEMLREAAISAGADTAFSAKEAAQGIDELAKAGVATKDILGGGLAGALSLAAAGSLDVAEAAEISASALVQFGLAGEDIPHLADLLAAGAGKAQGSVQDMGAALNQAGLVAASTGLSIEETTGGLAAFASAGLLGSDAGTSFKSMLQRLTPQSKEAESMMKELGISAYDAQGNFKGLEAFAGNLKTSMKDLTPEARNAAMGVIFGSDAVRAANVLYEQGAKGISDWTDKVNDQGYAAVTASIKTDNLAGDIEKLGGSFDSVLIKSGSGAAESLRGLVQGAEDLVDAIGKIPAPVLNAGVGIAGIAGGALLLGGVVMSALPKLMEFRTSMQDLATASPKAASGISKVGKAAGGAVGALVALQIAAAVFTEKHTKSAEDYGQAILKVGKAAGSVNAGSGLDSIFGNYDVALGQSVSNIDNLSDAVSRLTNQNFNDAGNKLFDPILSFLTFPKGEISQLEARLDGLGNEMGNLAKNGAGETAAKSFQALTKEFERNGKGAKEALDALPGYRDALMGLATQAGVTLEGQDLLDFAMGKVPASMREAAGATETFTNAAGQAKPVTEDMAKALEEVGIDAAGAIVNLDNFAQSLLNAGLLQLSARDAARGFQESIDSLSASVIKNGMTLDTNTEQGRANEAALDAIAGAGIRVVDSNAKAGASEESLQANLADTYNALIAGAGQLGITGQAAVDLARDVLKIPPGVTIEAWMKDHASAQLDSIKGKADDLDGRRVSMLIETINKQVNMSENRDDPSMVGLDPARHATGGRVYGPGTPTSDSVPALLSKDEFVIKASAAKAIGYGNLERLNGGDTQPLRAGTLYAPASAPARQASAPLSGAMGDMTVYVTNPFTGEEVQGIVRSAASSAVNAGMNGVAAIAGGRAR
ncbi:phage tail tape measure protein [Arthrobacter sp. 754]|uniref:phage tail tape measure protein n=1 Tax=Arthrobacter sp. 754 TaxID=3156315 RepID=UPI00339B6064